MHYAARGNNLHVLESMAAFPYAEEEGPAAQLTPSVIASMYGNQGLLDVLKYFEPKSTNGTALHCDRRPNNTPISPGETDATALETNQTTAAGSLLP